MKPSQNLLSWQVFVATCRTRSISQAAVLLDIDLPKASRLLSALETELGEPLFDKSHRPIQPTPRAAELQRAVIRNFSMMLNSQCSRRSGRTTFVAGM